MDSSLNEFGNEKSELNNIDDEIFKQLIKNSFDAIVLLDSNGIQRYVSESCERISGFKPYELVNIPVIETMVHPEDQQKVISSLNNIIKNYTNGGVQYRHKHKNGTWVYLEAFGTNQLNNPKINSIVLNVRDITEHKKIEKELIDSRTHLSEAVNTKNRFFSVIGHDLKGPFNSILGFSEILLAQIKKKNCDGIIDYAEKIRDSSQRAFNLLTNLLEWSQTQTGKIQFNPESLDIVDEINDVFLLLNDISKEKSIHISKKLPGNLNIKADKAMIKTILRNLITNAIKFTHSNGKIRISIEQKAQELVVSISDNGVGIKKENLDNLFQVDNGYSTLGTNMETGTGLGLLLCKEFIEMHNGKIWAESKEAGGSIFHFSLPK